MTFDPFVELCLAHGLPKPLTEFVFLPGRRFRADYAWLEPRKLIVEKNGGIFRGGKTMRGGHSSGSGILRDYEKSNLAQLAGFIYLNYTPQQLNSGQCLPELKILLQVSTVDPDFFLSSRDGSIRPAGWRTR